MVYPLGVTLIVAAGHSLVPSRSLCRGQDHDSDKKLLLRCRFPCLKTGVSHYVPPIRCYLWSAHSRTTISCGMFMVVLTTTSLRVSVLLSAFQHWSLALRDLRSYRTQTSHSEASPAHPSIHNPSLLILRSTACICSLMWTGFILNIVRAYWGFF